MRSVVLVLLCLSWTQPTSAAPLVDVISNELDRINGELVQQADPPYWMAVNAVQKEEWTVAALDGVTTTPVHMKDCVADVDVRVGTPTLDQTHKIRDAGWFEDVQKDTFDLPIDGNENAIRLSIWRAADAAYRQARKRLLKVKANLAVKVEASDTSADFSAAEKHVENVASTPFELDIDRWRKTLKRVSSRVNQHPLIEGNAFQFSAKNKTRIFVTTEGTELVLPEQRFHLSMTLSTTAEDGMRLQVHENFFGDDESDLPTEDELGDVFDASAIRLMALREAEVVDPVTAPAILKGRAAAVFFHEVLGHRIESHRQKDDDEGQTFRERVGQSILPSFIDVFDDPTTDELDGTPLNGAYRYDDEGVKSQRVEVVKNGILKNFLTSRTPIEGFPTSNGHGRRQAGYAVVSRQGNLLVKARNAVSSQRLRAMLVNELKRQGKPYGFIFEDITGGFTLTGRSTPNSFSVQPVGITRVWADNRPDELMRGADLIGTPLTAFSQILAAGNETHTFNGFCGAESGYVNVSASAPDLLIGEVEVQRSGKNHDRPPLLPAPGAQP